MGGVSLRDWDLATGRSSPFAYETKPELSSVEIVLKAAAPDALQANLAALVAAESEVAAIDKLLEERIVEVGALPNLAPLTATIGRMRALLQQYAAAGAADLDVGEAEASMAPAGFPPPQPASWNGSAPCRQGSTVETTCCGRSISSSTTTVAVSPAAPCRC